MCFGSTPMKSLKTVEELDLSAVRTPFYRALRRDQNVGQIARWLTLFGPKKGGGKLIV